MYQVISIHEDGTTKVQAEGGTQEEVIEYWSLLFASVMSDPDQLPQDGIVSFILKENGFTRAAINL